MAWITLGQAPDLHALQESLHLQLCGLPIPAHISSLPESIVPEQRLAALRKAARGTSLLLVLSQERVVRYVMYTCSILVICLL